MYSSPARAKSQRASLLRCCYIVDLADRCGPTGVEAASPESSIYGFTGDISDWVARTNMLQHRHSLPELLLAYRFLTAGGTEAATALRALRHGAGRCVQHLRTQAGRAA